MFKLSRLEGLSYDEIAERLHISRHTFKNHLVNAQKTTDISEIRHVAAKGSRIDMGSNKALLTLADGSVIQLDKQRSGIIARQGERSIDQQKGVVNQVEMMKKYKLGGSFLLQYNALLDPSYQKLLKELPENCLK